MHRSGTVFLLVLLLETVGALQRQWEKSCPHQCRCTATVLDCRGARLEKEDLETVHPKAFPELDTVDFYEAKFGDIGDGLFPYGVVHPMITSLNLTKCGVTRITEKTFTGVPNLEYLYLNDNQIGYGGMQTFEELKKLRKLDMTNSLMRRSTDQSNADLLAKMFEARDFTNNLVDLVEIVLNSNDLKFIHPHTFCKIRGLSRLELSNNILSNFEADEDCLSSLKHLDLSHNNFTTVTTKLWDNFKEVTAMDLSNNPLDCDCAFQEFLTIAQRERDDFLNQGLTKCASPPEFLDKTIFDLKENLCSPSGKGGFSWSTLFFLSFITGGIFFAYRHYSRRRRNEVPFEFGYSGLEAEEDVQPEFV